MLGLGKNLMKRPFNKQKYVLDQIKGSVFATSPYRLSQKATSPYTLSFSDGSPNFVVPFSNDYIDTLAVENYIGRNRVINPTMTVDTAPNDGIADNWFYNKGTYDGTILNEIDGGQKTTLNGGTNIVNTSFSQIVTISAGETINFNVEVMVSGNAVSSIQLDFYNGATWLTTVPLNGITNTSYQNKSILNSIAPPNTTKVNVILNTKLNLIGSTGSAWFRNASVKKVPAFAINDTMSVDSNADGVVDGWNSTGALATGNYSLDSGAQKLTLLTSSATGRIGVAGIATGVCIAGEIITAQIDTKLSVSTGLPYAQLRIEFKDSGNSVLQTQDVNLSTASTNFNTIYNLNKTAPANTAKFDIVVYVRATNDNDIGSAWFKNVKVYRSNVSAYVQQATDQSGNGNHAIQNTVANQPRVMNNGIWDVDANGKLNPVYTTTSSTRLKVTTVVINQPNTICAVTKRDVLGTRIRILDGITTRQIFDLDTGGARIFGGTFITSVDAQDLNSNVYTANYNSTNSKIYRNGINISSGDIGTNGLSGLLIGCSQTEVSPFFDGGIMELIIFNTLLTDSNRQKLERNQGKRYNITVA